MTMFYNDVQSYILFCNKINHENYLLIMFVSLDNIVHNHVHSGFPVRREIDP